MSQEQKPIAQRRLVRVLAWLEVAILNIYGLVLTIAGLLVQSGVIAAAARADHRALAGMPTSGIPGF